MTLQSRNNSMKNIFSEFKTFITRGNVIDMSVGVIVGGAFTAIVNGMGNYILKPLINAMLAWTLGDGALEDAYTILVKGPMIDVTDEAGNVISQTVDLAQSIYIDWGAFINTVISFFVTAVVLFAIVKIINRVREGRQDLISNIDEGKPTREERKEMKKLGIKFSDKAAVAAYYAEKAKKLEDEKKAAEEAAVQARLANPTTEDLLTQIRDLLQKNA